MRLGTIAFLAGILIFHALPALPARYWGFGLPVALILIWCMPSLRLPACGLAGFLWALIWVPSPPQWQLPPDLESKDLRVVGWIASIPESFYRSTRFQLEVNSLSDGKVPIPFTGKLYLYWYEDPPALRVGDKWALTVRLKRSRGLANPGGFDYERWLFIQGIGARGYVRANPKPQLQETSVRYPLDRFRQKLADRFQRLLPNNPYTGILIALAVGERQGIESWQWQVFTRTGTGHLMAISGLHVGLVAALLFFVFRCGWSSFAPLSHRWPAIKAAALAAIGGASGYALLAGLAMPTRRALVMITVVMLALLWQRPVIPSRILAIALLVILLLNPTAPLAGGFWLSFTAVAVILYALAGRAGTDRPLRRWIYLQLVIFLALLPVVLFLFRQIPVVSPLANLIAIPWATITVVPLTLLAVLAGFVNESLQTGLLELSALAMDWLWRFLVWLSNFPWAFLFYPAPPVWILLFVLPGLLLLLSPAGVPGRWLGGVLCLPLFFFPSSVPAPGVIWFTLLDVGQGLAAVIRTTQHVLIYDTGPRRGSRFDAGQMVLLPFLRQQGIDRIDTLIISHRDNEHMGGTRSLLEQMKSKRILTSSPLRIPIEGAESCRASAEWVWDEVRFHMLHPPENQPFSGNDASCVLLVSGKGGRVLLTGDIEMAAQKALLETYAADLQAEVLVAPHHGSRNLSLRPFIAAVKPHYVLFSTGYKNRFGYPRRETLEPYVERGAVILDTVRFGAITFRLTEGVWRPEFFRHQSRHYWREPNDGRYGVGSETVKP